MDDDSGVNSFQIERLALQAFSIGTDEAPLCFVQLWDQAAEFFKTEAQGFRTSLGEARFSEATARLEIACQEAHSAWFILSLDAKMNAKVAVFKLASILDESLRGSG